VRALSLPTHRTGRDRCTGAPAKARPAGVASCGSRPVLLACARRRCAAGLSGHAIKPTATQGRYRPGSVASAGGLLRLGPPRH
jgi:hypothetical protein